MTTFGERLRLLRKQRGLNQSQLSKVLGIGQTTIANYEKNMRFPNEDMLMKIADYFDVSLDYLFGRVDQNKRMHRIEKQDSSMGIQDLKDEFLSMLMDSDEDRALELLMIPLSDGIPVQVIYEEIIQDALYQVGALWETGVIDVASEHLISEMVSRIIARLDAYIKPKRKLDSRVLCMTINGEIHTLGLRMVNNILKEEGFKTFYLGINVPIDALIQQLIDKNIDFLVISVTMESHLNVLELLIRQLKSHQKLSQLKVIVGGMAFTENRNRVKDLGADFYGEGLEETIEYAKTFLTPN